MPNKNRKGKIVKKFLLMIFHRFFFQLNEPRNVQQQKRVVTMKIKIQLTTLQRLLFNYHLQVNRPMSQHPSKMLKRLIFLKHSLM
jgi:hypothetical protein